LRDLAKLRFYLKSCLSKASVHAPLMKLEPLPLSGVDPRKDQTSHADPTPKPLSTSEPPSTDEEEREARQRREQEEREAREWREQEAEREARQNAAALKIQAR
jgi:hypothetical protein